MKSVPLAMLVFLLAIFSAHAQISGTWTGNYSKTLLSMNPRSLVVELSLYKDSLITGASHLYYGNGKYEHHKITGKYNRNDSSALFYESLIETNVFLGVYEVLYKVKLISNGNNWRLEGKWKGRKSPFGYFSYNKVSLEKPKDPAHKKDTLIENDPIIKKDTLTANDSFKIVFPAAVQKDMLKLKRIADIQKIIDVSNVEKDSIHLSVYDNGEIDHDSISVYLNDKPVILHQMISDKPLSFYLSLDKDTQFQKIKMIAENLGTIPPNTAIMIITTRKKRYEVRMSSDLEKNAVVEFVLTD